MALSPLDLAYRSQLATLRARVVAIVEQTYGTDIDPDAIAASFDAFAARVAPTIETGQAAAQTLTQAYLAQLAETQGLDDWEPVLTPDVAGTNRAGTPLVEALSGIVPLVLGHIGDGTPVVEALDSGRYYSSRLADNEVRDAADREREQQQSAPEITGWHGDAGECERCQDNNGDHDASEEPYRHPGCTCLITPIFVAALESGGVVEPLPEAPAPTLGLVEAEDRIVAALNDPNTNLFGIDPSLGGNVAVASERLATEFPRVVNSIKTSIHIDSFGNPREIGATGIGMYNGIPGGFADMRLNGELWGNRQALTAALVRDEASGWAVPGATTPESVIYHEFGHIIDNYSKHAGSAAMRELDYPALSLYGKDDAGERFAEAFRARYTMAEAEWPAEVRLVDDLVRQWEATL